MASGKPELRRQTVERKVQLALRDCTQATRALERLQACVEEALELSLRVARQYGDTAEEYRVQESRSWLDTEGKKIISSIRRKIAFADADTRLAMADSLTAAIESGQAAMERSLDDSENRYLLWQWADRILSSVQCAFESLPEGERWQLEADGWDIEGDRHLCRECADDGWDEEWIMLVEAQRAGAAS